MIKGIDFPLTKNDSVILTGTLNNHDTYGNGTASAAVRHVLSSDSYLDVTI